MCNEHAECQPSLFIGAYPARHNEGASVIGGSHEEWKTELGIPDSNFGLILKHVYQ
jgi:hypothetical protein